MQTLNIDGTTYTLKFDKCPIAWAKKARTKPRKTTLKAEPRLFPTFETTMSTRDYIERYQMMNVRKHGLVRWHFNHAYNDITPQYDPSLPLVEVLS
jgi:hypothetical protein